MKWPLSEEDLPDGDGYRALTREIIGAAIEVHRHLGPGLLESSYQRAFAHELGLRGFSFRQKVPVPVTYTGIELGDSFEADLVVEDRIVIELKASEMVHPIHLSQTLTYVRLLEKRLGLLINFNVPVLHEGVHRVIRSA